MFTYWVYSVDVIARVYLSRQAMKELRTVPRHIALKLMAWVEAVETEGLEEVRKVPGYHDEPLSGPRRGERSIRLSRAYRAIYRVAQDGFGEIVKVDEVSKHGY